MIDAKQAEIESAKGRLADCVRDNPQPQPTHPAPRLRFDDSINANQVGRIRRQHTFACEQIQSCSSLSREERRELLNAYNSIVDHDAPTIDPNNFAEVPSGQRLILLNFSLLDSETDDFVAQVLIHEMAHIAGFSHPERQPSDMPNDNGPYFGRPPGRAELCIGPQINITCSGSNCGVSRPVEIKPGFFVPPTKPDVR